MSAAYARVPITSLSMVTRLFRRVKTVLTRRTRLYTFFGGEYKVYVELFFYACTYRIVYNTWERCCSRRVGGIRKWKRLCILLDTYRNTMYYSRPTLSILVKFSPRGLFRRGRSIANLNYAVVVLSMPACTCRGRSASFSVRDIIFTDRIINSYIILVPA